MNFIFMIVLFSLQAHLKRWVDVVVTSVQSKPVRRGEVIEIYSLYYLYT